MTTSGASEDEGRDSGADVGEFRRFCPISYQAHDVRFGGPYKRVKALRSMDHGARLFVFI